MPEQNLNPDALEAMSRVMNPHAWGLIDRYPEDELVIMTKEAELAKAEKLAAAYLSALPTLPKLDQRSQRMVLGKLIGKALHQCGISVTYAFSGPNELFDVAGILLSEYPALASAQPDTVDSVEELDKMPVLSVIRTDKGWVYERRGLGWMTTGLSDVADLSTNILFPATVLYRPVEG